MDQTELPIRFSRHNFENLQSLIRFADAKAGALAGFVFILVGTGSSLFLKAVEKFHFSGSCWRAVLGFLFCISWAAFLVIAIVVVLKLLLQVVLPRSAKHYSSVDHRTHLMYWEHIALRPDNAAYAQDVAKLDPATELRNLTDQVYELAKIVQAKMQAINSVRISLFWMTLSWLVGTLSAVIVNLNG
jgi:hypothetical protein